MARDLLAQDSVAATLERITASATELVEGCDAAGILVLHDSTVESLAPPTNWSTTATSCNSVSAKDPASMPLVPRKANESSASPTSPDCSSAGLPTLPRPTPSEWAA